MCLGKKEKSKASKPLDYYFNQKTLPRVGVTVIVGSRVGSLVGFAVGSEVGSWVGSNVGS